MRDIYVVGCLLGRISHLTDTVPPNYKTNHINVRKSTSKNMFSLTDFTGNYNVLTNIRKPFLAPLLFYGQMDWQIWGDY
jgi:hypothetical protein